MIWYELINDLDCIISAKLRHDDLASFAYFDDFEWCKETGCSGISQNITSISTLQMIRLVFDCEILGSTLLIFYRLADARVVM